MAVIASLPRDPNETVQNLRRERLYHAALLKSADGHKEFTTDLQTLMESGVSCEDIIKRLEVLYLPYVEDQRLEVVTKLSEFSKNPTESKKTLLMRFDCILNDAKRLEYNVSEETKMLTLLRTLTPHEKEVALTQILAISSTTPSDTRMNYTSIRRAVEILSTLEGLTKPATSASERLEGVMTVVTSVPPRSWKPKVLCPKCGRRPHFGDRLCPALDRKCLHCGTIGHFAAVCPSKRKEQPAMVATQLIDAHTPTRIHTSTSSHGNGADVLTSTF
eukprot:GHVR01105801.1.p1 GENE.GHVR01105801.1~~GHVR01105801.1.p1  ORF type:complete len:275 (+),score=21.81 GHVR01105801.1:239-1063(+)